MKKKELINFFGGAENLARKMQGKGEDITGFKIRRWGDDVPSAYLRTIKEILNDAIKSVGAEIESRVRK